MYMTLGIIVAVIFIGYVLFNNSNMRSYNHYMKRKKKLEESIKSFTATQIYSNQNVVLAVNEQEKTLGISTMKKGKPIPLIYNFNDIVSCEIMEFDVNAATSKKQNNQRVAKVLGDSVGKVLGKEEADRINRIDLKISFNDAEHPYVLANFLFWEVSKDSEEYKVASEAVSRWYGIINNIIKKEKKLL